MLTSNLLIMIAAFAFVTSVILLFATMLAAPQSRVERRLDHVSAAGDRTTNQPDRSHSVPSVLPRMGRVLMPDDESKIARLTARLRQAGFYQRHTTAIYYGVVFMLMAPPIVIGLLLSSFGMLSLNEVILFGLLVGLLGTLSPAMWLRHLKVNRQRQVRRAMPDALDVIVVCLEGGLSLPGSFARVTNELQSVHPLLASEMAIVRREIQLGRSTGEALRHFAERFDAEELRSMASVVTQAERFGASVVKALRVHADTLRLKRHQHAEAQAQKSPIKLIFPVVLCIFPALHIVLMGPAGVILWEMLDNLDPQEIGLWLIRNKMSHRHQHIVTRRVSEGLLTIGFFALFCLAYASGYCDLFFRMGHNTKHVPNHD